MKSSAELIETAKEYFGRTGETITNAYVCYAVKDENYEETDWAAKISTPDSIIIDSGKLVQIFAITIPATSEVDTIEIDDPNGFLVEGIEPAPTPEPEE